MGRILPPKLEASDPEMENWLTATIKENGIRLHYRYKLHWSIETERDHQSIFPSEASMLNLMLERRNLRS